MRSVFGIALFLAWSNLACVCQGKGEVNLLVTQYRGAEYILNGKERLSNRALVLPEGDHRFTFWAPHRQMLDTTIKVTAEQKLDVLIKLTYTPEYLAFQQHKKQVLAGRVLYRTVPIVLPAGSAVFLASRLKANREAHDALVQAEESYAGLRGQAAIADLKGEQLPRLQDELDRSGRQVLVASGITVFAAAATVFGFLKAAAIEDPVYEDKEKIKFDALVWNPGGQDQTLLFGMTIPLR